MLPCGPEQFAQSAVASLGGRAEDCVVAVRVYAELRLGQPNSVNERGLSVEKGSWPSLRAPAPARRQRIMNKIDELFPSRT